MPSVNHDTERYANNRAEVSHQPIRQREHQMRKFKSPAQTQRFLSIHGVVLNLFKVGGGTTEIGSPNVEGAFFRDLGSRHSSPIADPLASC